MSSFPPATRHRSPFPDRRSYECANRDVSGVSCPSIRHRRQTRIVNEIDRWFERTAVRQDRAVSLYASLLTGKLFAYFRYRLSFALVLEAARAVVHVAEFLIVLINFGGTAAFTVMVLRVGSLIGSGAWWGLLEVMRERIRAFSQAGDRGAVEREIGSWLILSAVAAATVLVVGGVALMVLLPPDEDPISNLYAFLIVIELALRLPVRVLHSGIFATRRIYRPLWSMLTPTAAQIAVVAVGVFLYPTTAVVIAIITSNAITIWITIHYTLRVYRLTGLSPKYGAPATPLWRRLPSISVRLGVEATLAALSLRLDAVIVLAIVGIYGTDTRSFDLTAGFDAWRDVDAFQFFYLILPLFRGAYEAAGVFYFDFVRLRHIPALRQYRLTFFHRLLCTTPIIALFFWTLAAALGLFVLPDIPLSFLLALMPLFVVRSVIGTYQIRMFAEGQFRTLIATVALLACLLWLVWTDVNPASDLVQITAAMTTLLIVHINVQHLRDRATALPTLLSLGDWIGALAREPSPVRAGRVAVPDRLPPRQRSAAVKLLQQTFDGRGHFAFRSPTSVVFYERKPAAGPGAQPHLVLQTITGGAISRGECMPTPTQSGREALDQIIADGWIPSVRQTAATATMPESLPRQFLQIFPDGFEADIQTREGMLKARTLDNGLLAGVLPTAMRSLEEGAAEVRVSGRWFTPIFHHGKLRLLFVLPSTFDAALSGRWLQAVERWQVGGGAMEGRNDARNG